MQFNTLVSQPGIEHGISFSADGRLMAYNSIVANVGSVYVEPYPRDGSSPVRVSRENVQGFYPVWTRTAGSLRLYYHDTTNGVIEAVDLSESLSIRDRNVIVEYPRLQATKYSDTIPDTDEILVRWPQDDELVDAVPQLNRIVVIENFTELLKDDVR